ncbi:MAG: TAT-variant-translocated molybdopterin oxidoreductase [Verrucomicrobia bacterium]|nr:TAT-variant-translocated molybdopterin oxidoreductase [Verrucomicrobiota bacterium]
MNRQEYNGWRSLEELADSPEFREQLHREFSVPPGDEGISGVSRRDFLRLLGGSFALAGLAGLGGCVRQPQQNIVPYIDQPERVIPGKALYYATILELAGFARGVVVETHEARPTKVEGNVLHPASLGATTVFEQAALLDLYNPVRSSAVLKEGEADTWPTFLGELQAALAKLPAGGAGLHILTGNVTSPTFGAQWQALLTRYPAAQWHQYEPLHHDAEFEGSNQAFGKFLQTQHQFDKARIIVSLGADFLFAMPGSVRYARDFISGRNIREGGKTMSRLYVLESAPTITGASADDRTPLRPSAILEHGVALAQQLGISVEGAHPGEAAQKWAATVAADLHSANGPTLIVAGCGLPPELHALAHAMNAALGNIGSSVTYSDPVEVAPVNQTQSLRDLATAIESGNVSVLLMLGGDWAHTAPADFEMDALIRRVPLSVHLGMYRNRTAYAARWHIPQAHPLEAWSDARAYDGTVSLAQPLIEPLFGGRTPHELIDCVAQFPGRHAHEILRAYWQQAGLDEEAWRRALHDGVIPNTAAAMQTPTLHPPPPVTLQPDAPESPELVFMHDYGIWDGRFSENSWLQELPRPINRLSWENALLVSPATAAKSKLATGDVVEIKTHDGRTLRGAVMIQPGMAEAVYAVTLGGGSRLEPGLWFKEITPAGAPIQRDQIAQNVGIDAYPVRTSAEPWFCKISLQRTGERHELAHTQQHHLVNSRDLVRIENFSDLSKLRVNEEVASHDLYNLTRTETDGIAWGMAIDLTRCIGCNACVLACQSENNIPPVGRSEVLKGREMHWIRIDSYYFGAPEKPLIAFQPMPCMHCETAPCEIVCPVAATLHDHEGLNVQVYNRCIGTRYCSNNCPYKVRRFNFFNYPKPEKKEPLLLAQNPNVTVRTRGVMEKCTYCVQRITATRIRAELDKRPIKDGEVVPACAQACPTEAIVFGNLKIKSRVAALKQTPLNYPLLEEANTHPRTTYLMRITNPKT